MDRFWFLLVLPGTLFIWALWVFISGLSPEMKDEVKFYSILITLLLAFYLVAHGFIEP